MNYRSSRSGLAIPDMSHRPEDTLPPDLYYNDAQSRHYTTNSRIRSIQAQMTRRALQLLSLPADQSCHVLDLGCGSGLSGAILTHQGHTWVGMDISGSMLGVALARGTGTFKSRKRKRQGFEADVEMAVEGNGLMDEEQGSEASENERDGIDGADYDDEAEMEEEEEEGDDDDPCQGDLLLSDIGQGLPFRAGTFDAAISISAVQWLCQAESNDENDAPARRLKRFFEALYSCLKRGGKAVLQFYPRNQKERDMVGAAARRAGFGAGFLVDAEGTKAEKVYLICSVGGEDISASIEGMGDVEVDSPNAGMARGKKAARNGKGELKKKDVKKGSREWITKQKERMERKGMVVKKNTKYTGRKRRPAF